MRYRLVALLLTLSLIGMSVAATAQKRRGRTAPSAPVVKQVGIEAFKRLLPLNSSKLSKPLLVNFWATWCDPCREEFPDLVQIDKDYRGKGLDFIAVSLDDVSDAKTTVPNFLSEMKATMPTYLLNVSDPEPAILSVDKSWSGALPATFLYDVSGAVVFKHFGRVPAAELRTAIDKVIAGK